MNPDRESVPELAGRCALQKNRAESFSKRLQAVRRMCKHDRSKLLTESAKSEEGQCSQGRQVRLPEVSQRYQKFLAVTDRRRRTARHRRIVCATQTHHKQSVHKQQALNLGTRRVGNGIRSIGVSHCLSGSRCTAQL